MEDTDLMKKPVKKAPRAKNKIPVRKRMTHVKRHVKPKETKAEETVTVDPKTTETLATDAASLVLDVDVESPLSSESRESLVSRSLLDHDYWSPLSRPTSSLSRFLSISTGDLSDDTTASDILSSPSLCPDASFQQPSPGPSIPAVKHESHTWPSVVEQASEQDIRSLLMDARGKLFVMLPEFCLPVVDHDSIHVVMLGRRESKAVQREIVVSSNGSIRIEVHGRNYPIDAEIMSGVRAHQNLSEDTVNDFVDRVTDITNNVRMLEICVGMETQAYKEAWTHTNGGDVETDVFKECRYRETFRSKTCTLLVPAGKWRCKNCNRLQPILKRKAESLKIESPNRQTNIRFLSEEQKTRVLKEKQKTIKNRNQTIERMKTRIKELIKKEGMAVDKEMSDDIIQILKNADLSPSQSLFLQQQMKAISCKKSCGMRWHPTLIRFALSIYLKAPGAYKDLCESGFVKLPTARTLFDYSHVTKVEPGLDKTTVETVSKQASAKETEQKQYHVVMADEMHISKNLVLLKSTGEIIGFKDLDVIDEEVATLEQYLDDPDKPLQKELACKVMSFMVKGVSSKLKHVIASYPVCNPSPTQMYSWTWEVLGALEKSGVRVIAFTCDGCPSNRAFIKLHKPHTVLPSGVIFDTINKFAPDRILYFFSDVPHLLKTIRNAFYNSRKNKKGTRLLKKNNQLIVWDTIIRLYMEKKDKVLRKAYKLNAQNVFPDSFSRMKVHIAAEVLSLTVSIDLQSQGWQETSETVKFIEKTNYWFDLLNGAFSNQGSRKNNHRLEPYTMKDVEEYEKNAENSRFQELMDFLEYLHDWKQEVKDRQNASLSIRNDLGVQPLDEGSFHALDDTQVDEGDEQEDFAKNLLPHQSLLGVEMSTRAFIGAVTFLLKEGVTFINARVFCQDPLEQNFGKQRMGGGGSNNPNYFKYLHKQRGISLIGTLSEAKSRGRGNTEVLQENVEIDNAPLPKRKRVSLEK